MNKYTIRRIMVIIILILATIGAVKAVNAIGEFMNEDFACKTAVTLNVTYGDTVTELAEQQIVSGNCVGYQSLVAYIINQVGDDLQSGDIINIPLHK